MLHKNMLKKRIAAPAVVTLNNAWKMIKRISILCMVLVLLTGCRITDLNANGEKNMILIFAGEFEMGNNETVEYGPYGPQKDESPVHTVYVDAFYIDIYEVTNADYKKFIDANPKWEKGKIVSQGNTAYLSDWEGNAYPSGKGDYPVNVNWRAAMAYAVWVGKRLPTEAEWEKAARGGLTNKSYPWGDSIDTDTANYEVNPCIVPVGSYAANNYGLYDMGGNVVEWCLDEYQTDFYKDSPKRNPIAGADNITDIVKNYKNIRSRRVLRGGGWVFGPDQARVSGRWRKFPEDSSHTTTGFRCVKPAKP